MYEAVDGRADDDLTRADPRRETIALRVPDPFCEVGLHRVVVDGGGAAGLELATHTMGNLSSKNAAPDGCADGCARAAAL